jgi:hypothetical protein
MRIAVSIGRRYALAFFVLAAHETPPPRKPDPSYREQDHIIFAALAIPIFAVSFVAIALIVTIGQR